MSDKAPRNPRSRRRRTAGAQMVEFTLTLLPLLAMVTVLMDTAWAIFVKATLQRSVRLAVRQGITLTSGQMATGWCLTDTVQQAVQNNAFGLLNGSAGLALIKVTYYQPPQGTATAVTDVTSSANADAGGNIIQVSVQNYSLASLIPRFYSWKTAADNAGMLITVYAADLIEPTNSPPCVLATH